MSHYVTVKCTALTDVKIPVLKEAVKKINPNYRIVQTSKIGKEIPTFGMSALLFDGRTPLKYGFRFTDGKDNKLSMEIGGEFYRANTTLEELTRKVCYNYSIALAEKMIHNNGYRMLEQKTEEDGTIHMTVQVAA